LMKEERPQGDFQIQEERRLFYVALTRARERTDIYTSREDLGHQGIDSDAISRLAERASKSNAQQASVTRAEIDEQPRPQAAEPSFGERLRAALEHQPDPASDRSNSSDRDRDEEQRSWFAQQLDEIRRQQAEHARDHDLGEGFEL